MNLRPGEVPFGDEGTVRIWVQSVDATWFAVASHLERLVATAVASTRDRVVAEIGRHVPRGFPTRFFDSATEFERETIQMLVELETGNESNKRFSLSEACLPDGERMTLLAAASIPLGYVTTYGDIATISGMIPRVVGRMMATNPLYPVVPCHRVVGAEMELVGYGGRKDEPALRSKLERLKAEARGCAGGETIVGGRTLPLYPVELVIRKAASRFSRQARQLSLF